MDGRQSLTYSGAQMPVQKAKMMGAHPVLTPLQAFGGLPALYLRWKMEALSLYSHLFTCLLHQCPYHVISRAHIYSKLKKVVHAYAAF